MLKRILLSFLFISSFVNAQSITSSVDSTQIKIGSQFNLTIKVNNNNKVI